MSASDQQLGFPPTRWSLVESSQSRDSEGELCRLYWRPIFSHLRARGWSHEDAEDLTQSFIQRLITDQSFGNARKNRGRLRTFLLSALNLHLSDHLRYTHAKKRGLDSEHVALANHEGEFENSEHRLAIAVDPQKKPDEEFDHAWGLELLRRAHERVAADYARAGKEKEYELLRQALIGGERVDSKSAARALGIKPNSVRVLIHRLRQNFRAALRDETAETLSSRSEVEDELKHLLSVF